MEYSIDVLMQQSFYIIVLQTAFRTQARGGGGSVSVDSYNMHETHKELLRNFLTLNLSIAEKTVFKKKTFHLIILQC